MEKAREKEIGKKRKEQLRKMKKGVKRSFQFMDEKGLRDIGKTDS